MTEHKSVHAALLAAQPKFKKPKKDAENSHFKNKYADLESVVDAVKSALNEEGVVFFHIPEASELGETMVTILHHPASATEIRCPVPMLLGKRDSQGFKAASTYAKRIGLESVTGVAPSDDDDADAERQTNTMGAALKDAWKQGVLDSIPENASPAVKAKAFADAICADFEGKGEKALVNRWNKHSALIDSIAQRFPDLHSQIVDAYEVAMMAATGNDVRAAE